LKRLGILSDNIPPGSLSLVMVNAEIPPFVRVGEKIDATVAVYDGAAGLFGGQLLWTELQGPDGQVYAVAAGPLRVNGFSAGGAAGGVSKNHDTTAQVQAQVERAVDQGQAFPENWFRLLLINNDYTTAQRIAAAINQYFPGHARALDQGSVQVFFPEKFQYSKLDFVAYIHELRVVPDSAARVVINQKTGTIVFGQNVRLSNIAFANENLIVTTAENPIASQPAPLSDGQTVVLPRSQVTVAETGGKYNSLHQQLTVGDLAAALNAIGVSPQDLIAIFEGIKDSGALQAELIFK
jgi:flagellar P-ring protein precursor FlgI